MSLRRIYVLPLLMALPFAGIAAQQFGLNDQLLAWVATKWGAEAHARVVAWPETMKQTLRDNPDDLTRLQRANDFFNQVRWLSDEQHWQQEDYWATPVETLASNGGDCEDFSIGKYFTLHYTQLDPEKLRITYVKALEYNQAHMVLAYYSSPGAEPLILDNINKTILPASQRTDLLPIYSFNGDGLWLAKARETKLTNDSQKNLPQWRDLNERMMLEAKIPAKP